MPSLPPYATFPNLSCDALLLRQLDATDVQAWFERASNPRSSDLSGDPIPASIDTVFGWLDTHHARYRRGEGVRWAIVPSGTVDSVGSIGLSRLDPGAGTAELGAVIAEAHWGQGLGSAAARLVVEFAFDGMGLQEIRADCLARNDASIRVLTRLGFSRLADIENYANAEPGVQFALRRP